MKHAGRLAPALHASGRFACEHRTVASQLLLIDDDLRLTDMVGSYLRQNGFEVTTAPNLAAGRELWRQASFDALLLDLMLPDGDGLDFTR